MIGKTLVGDMGLMLLDLFFLDLCHLSLCLGLLLNLCLELVLDRLLQPPGLSFPPPLQKQGLGTFKF